jgi:RNA polymerase sigma-70 factor (family 1)
MSDFLASNERLLLSKLQNDDQNAFTVIFVKYYSDLVRFSYGFTKNSEVSEEIVQEVFLKLWAGRNSIEIQTSFKSFFLKAVQNRSLDYLRHNRITCKYASTLLEHSILSGNDTENYVLFSELEEKFNEAMGRIPVQYAEAFRMSRIETLNYEEIASKLGVSVRTVEVRVSKALLLLRDELKDFLPVLVIFYQLFG